MWCSYHRSRCVLLRKNIVEKRMSPLIRSDWRKSSFSRLLERSTEVLPSYSFSHALMSLGGMLNNLGLSSVKICTVLPYFAGEQGCSQKQPRSRSAFGHRYFALCLAASYPSLCIRKPNLQIGTPSLSMVKSSL